MSSLQAHRLACTIAKHLGAREHPIRIERGELSFESAGDAVTHCIGILTDERGEVVGRYVVGISVGELR